MDNCLNILIKNYKGEKGSFIYSLHEKNYFDKELYHEYYHCLSDLKKNNKHVISTEMLNMIFFTYDYFIRSIIWSLSPNDLSKINNINIEDINGHIDELSNLIMNEYFQNNI